MTVPKGRKNIKMNYVEKLRFINNGQSAAKQGVQKMNKLTLQNFENIESILESSTTKSTL